MKVFSLVIVAIGTWFGGQGLLTPAQTALSLDELPAEVRAALAEHAGGHALLELEREREGDATLFEAAWTQDGRVHEVVLTERGELVERVEVVPAAEVPAAIVAVADAALPGTSWAEAEVERRGNRLTYELEGVQNGQSVEIEIGPDGTVLGIERG